MDCVNIGGLRVARTAVLAPMAGVCDYAQRVLAREFGAALTFGEMVSSAGLVYGDKKSAKLLVSTERERPYAAQIFGNNPDFMARAAEIALEHEHKPDIIDINAGCPMPKITGNGAGSALLRDLKLLGEIITAVVKICEAGKIPVTVKIRTGWDFATINHIETAKLCEACGASAITVHARTREQFYAGEADWSRIAEVKQAVKIPVIGNGDVASAEKCKAMYEQTGCDLVMVGRAAWGAPWIFDEIKEFLTTSQTQAPLALPKKLEIMSRHVDLLIADKGETVAMKHARAHIAKYLRGVRGAAVFKNMCSHLSTREDFLRLVEKIKTDNDL
ncbi:MAG: tRNA dihydrouridine synthase DusB [Oscillospiraceae bacterium]|nr:tRNA dihydrouridine synthase DusB [Oscillospiraceae bacterium]